MAGLLDPLERLQLAGGALIVEITVDQFDRLLQAAGRFCLPDLAIAARPDPLDQSVAGNRLAGLWLER